MNGNPSKHKEDAASEKLPELIAHCPKCGGEVGLWSEDRETICFFCDHKVFEKEKTEH